MFSLRCTNRIAHSAKQCSNFLPISDRNIPICVNRCFLRTAAVPKKVPQESSAPKRPEPVLIPGKATKEGTELFIMESGLKLFHQFNISKLYINPIIHGPPRLPPLKYRMSINKKLANKQLITAVVRNKSNMVYVYNHYSSTHDVGFWNTTALNHLMMKKTINNAPNPHYTPREAIVTVAGLGLCAGFDGTIHRLNMALATTGLEFIDFAIVECNDNTFMNLDGDTDTLVETIAALEKLCHDGVLQSYGVQIAVRPFTHHTPPMKTHSNFMTIPSLFEDGLHSGEMAYADLIVYPISPTHAVPHTFPMLDPNPADYTVRVAQGESMEMKRRFTRAALDPFNCFSGGVFKMDDNDMGAPSPFTKDNAKQAAYQNPLDDPDTISMIKKTAENDAIYQKEKQHLRKDHPELNDQELTEIMQKKEEEKIANFEAVKLSAAKQKVKDAKDEIKRLQEMSRVPDLILISGMKGEDSEESDYYFGKELDDNCLLLENTPKLEDKALRIVLSVGCEVVIVESELSAYLQKLELNPNDLLTSDQTDLLFGEFGVSIKQDNNEDD